MQVLKYGLQMSEGPQVKLTTERLEKYLLRKKVTACKTTRPGLVAFAERARGRHITDVFCKGKHIFIRFGQDIFLPIMPENISLHE